VAGADVVAVVVAVVVVVPAGGMIMKAALSMLQPGVSCVVGMQHSDLRLPALHTDDALGVVAAGGFAAAGFDRLNDVYDATAAVAAVVVMTVAAAVMVVVVVPNPSCFNKKGCRMQSCEQFVSNV